jgi:hypothetical protein
VPWTEVRPAPDASTCDAPHTDTRDVRAAPQKQPPPPWPGPALARLEGALANVGALRIDARRTCLTGAFAHAISSDGPATLTLSEGRALSLVAGENTGSLPAR